MLRFRPRRLLRNASKSRLSYLPPIQHFTIPTDISGRLMSKEIVNKLFETTGSQREVREYLEKFAKHEHFAVIKVGGAVLSYKMDELVDGLKFLQHVGLKPILVHGGGPQVNEVLESRQIKSDYVGGQRITTEEILAIVREVLFEQNHKLVQALEKAGVRARPILTGVYTAERMTEPDLGLVGKITNVNHHFVEAAARDGFIPVLTCLAATKQGNALNVNADFAAVELSRAIKPLKTVWISNKGGLVDDKGKLMDVIDLSIDYDRLMNQEWFKHGDKLKLKLVRDLLMDLPRSSSVSITEAKQLSRELFTHRGSGTLITQKERILTFDNLESVNEVRLKDLIEDAFKGTLRPNYFDSIRDDISKIYVTENYNGVALMVKDRNTGYDIMCKFGVRGSSQSDGLGARLMAFIKKNHKISFWRSKKENAINSWYFNASNMSFHKPNTPWIVFGFGSADFSGSTSTIDYLSTKPPDILKSQEEVKSSLSDPVYMASRKRIGLIGARGYTGNELAKILDTHNHFKLSAVGSRQFEGKRACDFLETSSEVRATNITPEHMKEKSEQVDAWVLALPNNLAKDYVEQIPVGIPIVDLSADYRWDPVNSPNPNWNSYWQYGLPERKGNRERLSNATRVANPGCYASAAQLAMIPLIDELNKENPSIKMTGAHCFGISGYSGAGTTPSDKNNLEILENNILPYALCGHGHELEINHQFSHQLNNSVFFTPHVVQFFRGINMTVSIDFDPNYGIPTEEGLVELFKEYYDDEPFVDIMKDIPNVTQVTEKHTCVIGGFKVNKERNKIVVVSVLDNLLKGAASVCIQNLNLMFGYKETDGLRPKLIDFRKNSV